MTSYLRSVLALAFIVTPMLAGADGMKMDMGAAKSPADKAFMDSMMTMSKDMAVKPTGDTDTDFVAMMLPHHQGAVDMAKIELRYGKDPILRKLAADIVKSQATEIELMKSWQAKNGR